MKRWNALRGDRHGHRCQLDLNITLNVALDQIAALRVSMVWPFLIGTHTPSRWNMCQAWPV